MQGSWDGCYSVVRDYIYIILRMLGRLNVLCGVDVSMRPTKAFCELLMPSTVIVRLALMSCHSW